MTASVPTAFEIYFAGPQRLDERERAAREDLFFHSIQLRNGTYKSTAHHRLDDLNNFVMELLPRERPLEIMDVAVSSGVSTAEWLLALESAGIECHMLAGDALVDARLVSLGRLRALADKTGHLLQLDVGGRAIRLPPPRRRDRLRYALLLALMRTATRLFDLDAQAGQRRFGTTCRPVTLMSPSLTRLQRIRTVEDHILHDTGYARRFHVLRAANILNLIYFDVGTLERMLINLRSRLLPGGLLIVCRTNATGVNDATVFTLAADGRFTATALLNAGSEIEDLVLRLAPQSESEHQC
jgi:hypothetical protein